jgi:hypothetical protein
MSLADRTIRKSKLADQGKDDDLRNTTPEQRFAMTWQLAVDGYAFRGVHVNESQFPRHVGGVIRGKR